jgi:hypothetical protein
MSGKMTKVVKRIVRKPSELEKEREKWLPMERLVNIELRRIDPKYAISNLIKHPDGSIEFEASTEFREIHRKQIAEIFSLLKLEDKDTEFVQAKFYLPRAIQKRVKQWAIELDVPVSSLVAALLDERARKENA